LWENAVNVPVTCPNCHISFSEQDLVTKTAVLESCPYCRAVVRQQENFHWRDHDAIVREDLRAIEEWLDAVTGAEKVSVARNVGPGQAVHLWTLRGVHSKTTRLAWTCVVEYDAEAPRAVEVRLESGASGEIVSSNADHLLQICAREGAQPYETRTSRSEWGVERVEYSWGARRLLATSSLSSTLFRAVIDCLDSVMGELRKEIIDRRQATVSSGGVDGPRTTLPD
jgi:hypothetical protein